ncbi:MAG TPA: hypothetical protein VKV04_05220 [Verrucomicrobiae bacterium]|nr:hypothetical protein [Verrucomicrobiae bacterium]
MKRTPPIVLIATLAALPLTGLASTWSTTAQFGQYNFSSGGYSVNNDVWGSGAGAQTLYVNTSSGSAPNFWVFSQQPNTGGIKSYPHMAKTINVAINSLSSLTGSYNVANSLSSGTDEHDWAFDCWVPSEVMVWTKWTSGVGPWGTLFQSNVSIGGHSYNVYQPGGPWSFLRTSQSSASSDNLAAVFKWLVSNHHLSNGTVGSCQYGVEITSGVGWWTVNSSSIQ